MNEGNIWEYDLDFKTLLDKYKRAVIELATLISYRNKNTEQVRYLEGVMLSLYEGIRPPVKPTAKVTLNKGASGEANGWGAETAEFGKRYVVSRVVYYEGSWLLNIEGMDERALYRAKDFRVSKK